MVGVFGVSQAHKSPAVTCPAKHPSEQCLSPSPLDRCEFLSSLELGSGGKVTKQFLLPSYLFGSRKQNTDYKVMGMDSSYRRQTYLEELEWKAFMTSSSFVKHCYCFKE